MLHLPKLDVKTHWTPLWFFQRLESKKSQEISFSMGIIVCFQLVMSSLVLCLFSPPASPSFTFHTWKRTFFQETLPEGSPIFFGTCCTGMDVEWSHERSGWLWRSHRKQGQGLIADRLVMRNSPLIFCLKGGLDRKERRTKRKDIKESNKSKKLKDSWPWHCLAWSRVEAPCLNCSQFFCSWIV